VCPVADIVFGAEELMFVNGDFRAQSRPQSVIFSGLRKRQDVADTPRSD
jgi:hypothetical protein